MELYDYQAPIRRAANRRRRMIRKAKYYGLQLAATLAVLLALGGLNAGIAAYAEYRDEKARTGGANEYRIPDVCELETVECEGENLGDYEKALEYVEEVLGYVTGYNTVHAQTDAEPCIAASGANICGRSDVVACPRQYPLGTRVEIDGKQYVCEDRTARKYDGRWDISCDKDKDCPYEVTGYKTVTIKAND